MLVNFIAVFLIPWILGAWLYTKNDKIVLTIAPTFSVLSFVVNHLGVQAGYWEIVPVLENKSFSGLFYDTGIYPVLATLLVYLIHRRRLNPFILIVLITSGTTFLESIGYYFGRVLYANGWNFGWTFVSYLIPFSLTYLYYIFLNKKGFYQE
ncbi:CBO0543 family protein [Brevibacillus brevis]|uniref:CBO0543 family protein n=1 Tax=Brevibacillus brevis TaxID=1393 RepID=UPI000D11045A|nr:hypothetical protein C7J99_24890 [Brevibacillus brevis]RED20906.1 hypothetical protein DES34_1286 [Brevibacillus brevis]VEF86617.1 Uncharacterised protein [Brevibacillus brevis]